ncbi:hypothetical protein [Anaerolentibacter hominis]|uniref:hypothetical protein n=1 Tax=Anaerolentibacter hominis TaxID=3079009 RepID=UPI0031B8359B
MINYLILYTPVTYKIKNEEMFEEYKDRIEITFRTGTLEIELNDKQIEEFIDLMDQIELRHKLSQSIVRYEEDKRIDVRIFGSQALVYHFYDVYLWYSGEEPSFYREGEGKYIIKNPEILLDWLKDNFSYLFKNE